MYDLLIKNGQIFDGTGSGPFFADVAAVNGDIVAIGSLEGESAKTVDAAGLAVSPGFIDLHTHSDMSFLLDPTAQSKVRQGGSRLNWRATVDTVAARRFKGPPRSCCRPGPPNTRTRSRSPGKISGGTWTRYSRRGLP